MKRTRGLAALLLGASMLAGCFLVSCAPPETPDTNEKSAVAQTIGALRKQNTESVTLDVSADLQESRPGQDTPSDKLELSVQGKVNISDGDGDVVKHKRRTEDGRTEDEYLYGYARDWQAFTARTYDGEADPSGLVYNYEGELLEIFNLRRYFDGTAGEYEKFIVKYLQYAVELVQFDLQGIDEESYTKAGVNLLNAGVIALADAAGAVSVGEGKLNVDLHKTVKELKADVKALFTGITENTTTKELLSRDPVKKYMESLTQTVRVDEISKILLKAFNEFRKDFEGGISLTDMQKIGDLIAIKPNVSSTAYEYLLKIVTSDEAEYLLGSIFGMDVDFDRALWAQAEAGSWSDFYSERVEYVLSTLDMITADDAFSAYNNGWEFWDKMQILEFKNVTWTYTLNADGTVAALDVNGGVTFEDANIRYAGNAAAKLTFSGEKTALADIGGYTMKMYTYAPIPDGKSQERLEIQGNNATFYVYPIFKDNRVTEFFVTLVFGDGENTVAYERGQTELTLTAGRYSVTVYVSVGGESGWTDGEGNYYADSEFCSISMQTTGSPPEQIWIYRESKTAEMTLNGYLAFLNAK